MTSSGITSINPWKVLYFIFKEDARSTKAGVPYLSKYPDQFSNAVICPVSNTLVVSKFSRFVNEIYSQDK